MTSENTSNDDLIMDMSDQEAKAALLLLASASTSLECDGAGQVEVAAEAAIRAVLQQTRS